MGTDIHYIVQKKTDKLWETIDTDLDLNRHYLLFAVIAGVRNGSGFAGVSTHDPIVPIAKGRGLPVRIVSDWFDEVPNTVFGYEVEPEYKTGSYSLGEHSFNWLLGSEILNWFKEEHGINMQGVVSREDYFKMKYSGETVPENYCGDILGKNIFIYNEMAEVLPFSLVNGFRHNERITHVRIQWEESVNESISYFKDAIQKLVDEHGEIRLIMGFDS